jgi:hypothetical protein
VAVYLSFVSCFRFSVLSDNERYEVLSESSRTDIDETVWVKENERAGEVSDIQRESQARLKSIKENDFHCAFEAWRRRLNRC